MRAIEGRPSSHQWQAQEVPQLAADAVVAEGAESVDAEASEAGGVESAAGADTAAALEAPPPLKSVAYQPEPLS
jgi:hypothetical protein